MKILSSYILDVSATFDKDPQTLKLQIGLCDSDTEKKLDNDDKIELDVYT